MPRIIHSVVGRSKVRDDTEDAWTALRFEESGSSSFVIIAHFKAADFGATAFKSAEKHARRLAEELVVPFASKRDTAGSNIVHRPRGNVPSRGEFLIPIISKQYARAEDRALKNDC